jgi:membrane-associated phospholipid phosphatase
LFLVVCLSVGPGLLANVGFKDNWDRARPKQIVAFGGNKVFTPALLPTNQCKRNCSLVSGEASSVFAPFYATAAIAPQWAATLIVVGTAAGLSAGIVRIAQGAHFLSDVVFAGLFMGLLALALQRLMFAPRGSWPLVFKNRLHGRPVARTSAPSARACVSAKVTAAARLQVGALATSLRLTTGGPRASPDSSWPHHP